MNVPRLYLLVLLPALLASAANDYPFQPVPLKQVAILDGFWLPRFETNRLVTLWANFRKSEETGRISNFARAGKLEDGPFRGSPFDDSDVYKIVEGAADTLATHPDVKRMTWWPNKGSAEWLQYELPSPETVTGCAVYGFDGTGKGSCRVPASWKVQAQDAAGTWADVPVICPVTKDQLCTATFDKPVVTQALRLCAQLQPGVSGGVLEWQPLVK